jgi:hypothetical protein
MNKEPKQKTTDAGLSSHRGPGLLGLSFVLTIGIHQPTQKVLIETYFFVHFHSIQPVVKELPSQPFYYQCKTISIT